MSTLSPLSAEQIEEQLDQYFDFILSSRRTAAEPAKRLAKLNRAQLQKAFAWIKVISSTNAELAFQLANQIPHAMQAMDDVGIEAWILKTMDIYDISGLHLAIAHLKNIDIFSREHQSLLTGLSFEDISGVLSNFVSGLNGRQLKVQTGEQTYTDTDCIYLPKLICHFSTEQQNFDLYKSMAVYLWAQTWYGTWRSNVFEQLNNFPNCNKAAAIFHTIETFRLDACLAKDLPGIHRTMTTLRQTLNEELIPKKWSDLLQPLLLAHTDAETSMNLVSQLYDSTLPPGVCYQGVLQCNIVEEIKTARLKREKITLRRAIGKLQSELKDKLNDNDQDTINEKTEFKEPKPKQFKLNIQQDEQQAFDFKFDLSLDGNIVNLPSDIKNLITSVIQDLSDIPEEYLIAAGDGLYGQEQISTEKNPDDVWKGTYHEEGAFLYNEWDYQRRNYRKNWAVLREKDVHPIWDEFATQTIDKHYGLIANLRRTFEALRGEDKITKKQTYGEDIDIDAVVESFADVMSGLEMSERLFVKKQKLERNIAVMFMVDMSGSTKGWINDAERESLILLCESLETLGDRYAIYGFSGFTRKRCELYRIKRFNEDYNNEVRARISGIKPQDYTRMGVTIRHLSQLLAKVDAKTKLLITLSDGKPDDLDGYRGKYGIEDTRQALLEAKRDGIHPFCITIDSNAADYLSHMYGAVNYVVIDDVGKLPLKVSDIYRKLTT